VFPFARVVAAEWHEINKNLHPEGYQPAVGNARIARLVSNIAAVVDLGPESHFSVISGVFGSDTSVLISAECQFH